ncbi:YbaY family lipoprotein [Mesorhizobium wenxiniae]|uniref:Uncharacterized protein n=1 Tax=Mesorhizobium wenxiniae TaxID=2014805 RepID=A0A271KJL9_9HYPH|nr:hypothetical protein CIT31_14130 [Mesorhizobium wenxiniae]
MLPSVAWRVCYGCETVRQRLLPGADCATLRFHSSCGFIDLAKPKTALATTTVAPAGQVPIAFGLVVDSSKLSNGVAYAIQARIEVGGSAWFASAEPTPVDLARAGECFQSSSFRRAVRTQRRLPASLWQVPNGGF